MTVLYSPQGDLSLASGQALTVQRVFSDTSGAPVDLTGRSFTLTVFARDGSITPIAVDAIVSGPAASMTLTSAMTTTLHAANDAGKALGWQIVEHLAGGLTGFVFGPRGFAVTASGGVSGGVQSQTVAGAPVVQISSPDGGGTIRIDSFGAPGDSAGAQVKRARPTEIVDASDGAFATWAQKPALDAAGVAAAAAGTATAKAALADTAATNANAQAAAAQAVVAQQGVTLGQVAQAKTDAQAARDAASGSATATAADRVQTGQDRTATGQAKTDAQAARDAAAASATATTGDRTQTGLDRTATGGDRVQTGLDRVATGTAVTATAADRVQTGQDRTATAGDRTQTGLDRAATTTAAANAQAAMAYFNGQAVLGGGTGNVSGAVVPNLTSASSLSATLTGNLSLGPPNNPNGYASFMIGLQQDATGSRSITFDPVYAPRPGLTLSKTPGAIDFLTFTLFGSAWVVDINPFDSPFGGAATKNLGVSIVDRGDGAVEFVEPLQIITSASYDLTNGLYRWTVRNNAGAAMADTLPNGASLPNGARLVIENNDATASVTITQYAAGQTVNNATSIVLPAGTTITLAWNATTANWRVRGLPTFGTYVPILSFATAGSAFVLNPSVQNGWYRRDGFEIRGGLDLVCAPTYDGTTAGQARVTLPFAAAASLLTQAVTLDELTTSTNTAWPSTTGTLSGGIASGTAFFNPRVLRSGGTPALFTITQLPSGSTITIRARFDYRIA